MRIPRDREQPLHLAHTKIQSGKLLKEQDIIQLKINKMHMLIEALRSFVLWVALSLIHI